MNEREQKCLEMLILNGNDLINILMQYDKGNKAQAFAAIGEKITGNTKFIEQNFVSEEIVKTTDIVRARLFKHNKLLTRAMTDLMPKVDENGKEV